MTPTVMDLPWGPDFEAFSQTARRMCEADPAGAVGEEGPRDRVGLWQQLSDLGWPDATDPTGTDGDAASLASVLGIFVELGRALAVTPLPSAMSGHELRALVGAPPTGTQGLSVPLLSDRQDPHRAAMTLSGDRLTGTAMFVPYADRAEELLVESSGEGGSRLWVVARDNPQVRVEPLPNIADYPQFAVSFTGVMVDEADELGAGDDVESAISLVQQRAAVLMAAEVYGAGCSLLDKTVTYAREREQFGGPIGRFQAVQYLCTDIAVNLHLTSAFLRDAAGLLDRGECATGAVSLLRMQAAKTAQIMVHCAHEVHAGIGYMLESDIHLYTRAAKRWQFALGAHGNAHAVVSDLLGPNEEVSS
ncbi:acyl-CoA dehydrogenase family protein [Nocardioides sp.]|uniref:acyl-CoA dehydrogenase family protein n=1 Tax=Nocardioides sp. TaxID=35761 RepID=UPI003565DA09